MAALAEGSGCAPPRRTHRGRVPLSAPAVTVRRLTRADLPAFRVVRLAALQAHPEAFGSSYEEEAAYSLADFTRFIPDAPPSAGFGVFAGEALVGITCLLVSPKLKQRHKGSVIGVYLDPAYRGAGVAEQLLRTVIETARAEKLVLLQLTVAIGNRPAEALYERLGFRRYGVEHRSLRIGDRFYDEALMALDLA